MFRASVFPAPDTARTPLDTSSGCFVRINCPLLFCVNLKGLKELLAEDINDFTTCTYPSTLPLVLRFDDILLPANP